MKVLVLGSTGFVGKNICERLLDKNVQVHMPLHKQVNVLEEKTIARILDKEQYDIVINALDRPGSDSHYFENRLRMFYNIAKYHDLYGKMIYFGSGAEYGRQLPVVKVKEDDVERIIPDDSYGFCLQQMNQYARRSNNIYNLRLFGIFGKYELWNQRFISNAICKALFGFPITIRQDRVMDYLYIDDLCKMAEWVMYNAPLYHDYNAVSGRKFYLSEIAEMVKREIGVDVPIYIAKEGMSGEYTGDNMRLLKEMQQNPIEPMEESIHKLTQWYQENIHLIDKEKLLYQ